MPTEATDNELVTRLSDGDVTVLRELYARHAALVFTVAARIVPASQAEDIVQDVFLALWQKHATFDPERGSLRTWLARLARNRALNEVRASRARANGSDDELDAVADEALEPDEAQWAARRQAAVRAAVEALPETERRALSLAFLDELTHDQVAATLNTPLGTAKTRIRTALKRLAPVLAIVVALGAIFVAWRRADRDERALVLVTSSDVVPRRLEAAPGISPEAHGQFRARPGSRIAVLTTTRLPALPGGASYVAWARHGEHWTKIGVVESGHEERALLVAEDDALVAAPDELRVTLETANLGAPAGNLTLVWRP